MARDVLLVSRDWLNVSSARQQTDDLAVNAITGAWFQHDPIFRKFHTYEGPAFYMDDQRFAMVDFLGLILPRSLLCNQAYLKAKDAYAIRARQCDLFTQNPLYKRMRRCTQHNYHNRHTLARPCHLEIKTSWPVVSEEYWEYVSMLRAVDEYVESLKISLNFAYQGKHRQPTGIYRPFVVIELGAGYGHWSFSAMAALKGRLQEIFPTTSFEDFYRLALFDVVEGFDQNVETMWALNSNSNAARKIFKVVTYTRQCRICGGPPPCNNGWIDPKAHWNKFFEYNLKKASQVWGISNNRSARRTPQRTMVATLNDVQAWAWSSLRTATNYRVDILNIDVQGDEYTLFDDEVMRILTSTTIRVHVGLHSYMGLSSSLDDHSDIENQAVERDLRLRSWFETYGWYTKFFKHARFDVQDTGLGPVHFVDGVASFMNIALAKFNLRTGI